MSTKEYIHKDNHHALVTNLRPTFGMNYIFSSLAHLLNYLPRFQIKHSRRTNILLYILLPTKSKKLLINNSVNYFQYGVKHDGE